MDFINHICKKCKKDRKFVKGSLRETKQICGECWDWNVSDDDYLKAKKSRSTE